MLEKFGMWVNVVFFLFLDFIKYSYYCNKCFIYLIIFVNFEDEFMMLYFFMCKYRIEIVIFIFKYKEN